MLYAYVHSLLTILLSFLCALLLGKDHHHLMVGCLVGVQYSGGGLLF